jgi:hypothetical protein
MKKIIELDDVFPTGETTVQPVLLWGPGRSKYDLSHVTKHASEALDYIKHVTPEPGKTSMLLLAMGGEETYGPNRNGDGFPENPVPARNGKGWHVAPGQELTKHYGSFETNPAHAFKHHQNKDPAKASGVVKKAFWNGRMHRVELLVTIDNEKDAEWVERVNDGDFPAVSMGCRIKYDVCAKCGNRAPTRAQYCDHVKFAMNQINPDGTKNYVHNPDPSFFDISRVLRPADRNGYTLKKVADADIYEIRTSAELGDIVASLDDKSAAIRKISDIDKVIRGEAIASSSNLSPKEKLLIKNFRDYAGDKLSNAPTLPMDVLLKHSAAEVFSTTTTLGIALKDAEFIEYMVSKLAGRPVILGDIIEKTAALLPAVYDLFEASPSLCERVLEMGVLDVSSEKISADLEKVLTPYVVKRAYVGEMLYRRLVPEGVGIRPDAAPTTDLMSYTDPSTGQTMQTTRGAALDARDAVTRAHLRKMVGGSAMLLGGYKMLTAFPSMRRFKLPVGLGAAALGAKWLPKRPGQEIQTNEGYNIPDTTEFAPKFGSDTSLSGVVAHLIESSQSASQNKYASLCAHAVKTAQACGTVDSVRGLELDFETTAENLGLAICG